MSLSQFFLAASFTPFQKNFCLLIPFQYTLFAPNLKGYLLHQSDVTAVPTTECILQRAVVVCLSNLAPRLIALIKRAGSIPKRAAKAGNEMNLLGKICANCWVSGRGDANWWAMCQCSHRVLWTARVIRWWPLIIAVPSGDFEQQVRWAVFVIGRG